MSNYKAIKKNEIRTKTLIRADSPESEKLGYLWCLLNSLPNLDYFAAIKLMDQIKNQLGDDKISYYWQKFTSIR